VLYLLKCLDEESEGLLILESIFIFKDMQWLINKNNLLLFQRQKHNPTSNNVIITEVMVVISGKHSDRDSEPD
jgi:hypothetical protein